MKKYLAIGFTLMWLGLNSQGARADMNGDQPETPAGMNLPPVAGSPEKDIRGVPKLAVEFQTDHWDIPASYSRDLDIFGKYLQGHPESRADIVAYADHTGRAPANVELSHKRARAVCDYLTTHYGVSVDRITAQGYGEVSDKIHNDTVAGRQADRQAFGTIINPGS